MKSFMEECKGSIMNVPGCDGTINDHPKSEAQKHQTRKNLTWLGGEGGIIINPVRLTDSPGFGRILRIMQNVACNVPEGKK